MKYAGAEKWWASLPVYLLGGFALGLVNPALRGFVGQLGVRPGLATAALVNILLPLLAIGLAVAWPRLMTAWLGAVGMTAAFILGLAVANPQLQPWDFLTLLRSVPPVLVVACLGYGVLGSVSALLSRSMGRS
jgi:hypothetical protein